MSSGVTTMKSSLGKVNKIVLTANDDKRIILADGVHTLSHGHFRTKPEHKRRETLCRHRLTMTETGKGQTRQGSGTGQTRDKQGSDRQEKVSGKGHSRAFYMTL